MKMLSRGRSRLEEKRRGSLKEVELQKVGQQMEKFDVHK